MKNILGILALFAIITAGSSAQAQVAYNNSVLRGCYSFLTASVDTEITTRNRAQIGTLCFNGASVGALTHASGPVGLTGLWGNNNGTVNLHSNVPGTYTVTNLPGDGMGTFQFQGGCAVFAFSVNAVDNSVPPMAHGFQFALQQRLTTGSCTSNNGPFVSGGNAYYQGP
jgi:hypothetical protein